MAIAFVQRANTNNAASTSTPTCAFGSNTTTGNCIVVMCPVDATVNSISDLAGNTYVLGKRSQVAQDVEIWYALNITGATTPTITVHLASAQTNQEVVLYEFSGVATSSAIDQTQSNSATNTAITSNSVTTLNANDLLLGCCHVGNAVTAAEAGWTTNAYAPTTNGNGAEYNIVSSTASYAATFTQGASAAYDCVFVSLKASAGIVAPTVTAQAATNISTTSATLNGTITATGGANATAEGFNWGLTGAYGNMVSASGSFGTGTFSQVITGLSPGQTYHYQAFATNSAGTGNSSDNTFTALSTPPLTWDSSSSLWDQNVVAWNAGAPMTWDSPTANWNDVLNAWDVGTVTWDTPWSNWDDPLLGWNAGSPITWDAQSTLWDSPSGVWDVGNLTWDNLNTTWDSPLVAWDAAFVTDWDSAVTLWDSTVNNWDAGAVIVLGSVNMQGAFGIRNSPVVVGRIASTTLQGAFGIRNSPVIVGKIANTTMQALFGIRNAPAIAGVISGLAMQALLGIRNAPQVVGKIASLTMQALLGITTATIGKLLISTTPLQGQLGIRNLPVLNAGQQIPPQMIPYSMWGGGHY